MAVSKRMLCGQYAQSSGHAPVLIDSSVETCTAFGSKFCRCTHCAEYRRSLNGSSNSASTSRLRPVGARLDVTRTPLGSPRGPARVSFSSADIRRSLPARLPRDDGASQTPRERCQPRGRRLGLRALAQLVRRELPGLRRALARRLLRRLRRGASRACRTPARAAGSRGPWRAARARRRPGTSTPCVAPFSYGPPLDHYVHALKYRGARSLGRAFALLLAPALAHCAATSMRSWRCRCIARACASAATTRRRRSRARSAARCACRRSSAASRAVSRRRRRRGRARASGARAWRGRFASQRDLDGPAHRDRRRRRHDGRHRQRARRRAASRRRGALRRVRRGANAGAGRPLRRGTCSRAGCRRKRRRRARRCSRKARNDWTMSRSLMR